MFLCLRFVFQSYNNYPCYNQVKYKYFLGQYLKCVCCQCWTLKVSFLYLKSVDRVIITKFYTSSTQLYDPVSVRKKLWETIWKFLRNEHLSQDLFSQLITSSLLSFFLTVDLHGHLWPHFPSLCSTGHHVLLVPLLNWLIVFYSYFSQTLEIGWMQGELLKVYLQLIYFKHCH